MNNEIDDELVEDEEIEDDSSDLYEEEGIDSDSDIEDDSSNSYEDDLDYSNESSGNRLNQELRTRFNDKKNEYLKEKLNQVKNKNVQKNISSNPINSVKPPTTTPSPVGGTTAAAGGTTAAAGGTTAAAGGTAAVAGGTAAAAGGTAAAAGGTAAAAGGSAAAGGLAALAANPVFWIVVAAVIVLVIIIIVVVSWGAYDSESNSSNGESGGVTYVEGYESCESITVTGYGTYPIDDYIAGVIQHESYQDSGIESLKAQAVAARTYAINSTDNCAKAIGNSTYSQTFSDSPSDLAKQAANETSGQVLTYDGKVFAAMYDSFCYADSDCPDSKKNENGTYTVTYTKKPNNETHSITLSDSTQYKRILSGAGHASGMSQLVSYQMSKEGKKYDEILYYFYSDGVKIETINKSASNSNLGEFNGSFNIRGPNNKPNWLSEPDSTYFNKTINGGNWFQCVWYAKARAYEALSTMTTKNEDKRSTAIEALLNSHGNGKDWYSRSQNGGSLSMMASSNDYTKPRPGSLVSWKWNSNGCINYYGQNCNSKKPNYGHVAFVESVDENAKTAVISDGWYECGSWDSSSCFGYRSRSVSFDYIKSFGGKYIFEGYVYLADYVGG